MVMANGVFGMTLTEALKLSDAVADVAEGRKPSIELWSEGTIGEKVEG